MAQVYSIDGVIPVVHPEAYVHPTAVLIGDVIIGPGCYVGPCASPARRFRPPDPGARLEPAGWLRHAWLPQHRYGDRAGRTCRPWRHPAWLPHRPRRAGRHECGGHGWRRSSANPPWWRPWPSCAPASRCRRAASRRVFRPRSCARLPSATSPGSGKERRIISGWCCAASAALKAATPLSEIEANRPRVDGGGGIPPYLQKTT